MSSSKRPHFLQKFHQNRYSKNLKCNECYVTNIIKKITTTLTAIKLPLISTPILYGLFITTHSYSILIQCWIVTAVLLCSALPNTVTTPRASHPITLPWAAIPQRTDTCLKNGDRTPLGIHTQEVFHFSIQVRCQTFRLSEPLALRVPAQGISGRPEDRNDRELPCQCSDLDLPPRVVAPARPRRTFIGATEYQIPSSSDV